jgi:DNA-binding transcriptional regulator YiaG
MVNPEPKNPTPSQITRTRTMLGLTRAESAKIIYCGKRAWQEWELGNRKMHPALWELFKIKTQKLT